MCTDDISMKQMQMKIQTWNKAFLSLLGMASVVATGCGVSQAVAEPPVSDPSNAPAAAESLASPREDAATPARPEIPEPAEVAREAVAEPIQPVAKGENVEIPEDFVNCEVRVDIQSALYTAQAAGPTLEEARDNAVDEACAIPCAMDVKKSGISEDAAEETIDTCSETNVARAIVIAAACTQNGKTIYTEGAWNENGDAAPTNGEESHDTDAPKE